MNNVEIVEWWHYKMSASVYSDDLFIIKLVKLKRWFKWVDWIVWENRIGSSIEYEMTLKEFKNKVLYKVN